MVWLKRVAFFGLVNIGIIVMLSLVINILGLDVYLQDTGYGGLFMFCLFWGTGGAFISLWISKWMAKRAYGVQIVDDNPQFKRLVDTVRRLSRMANLETAPEVGVFDSPAINAFATGPSRNNSMVCVSTGLLHKMEADELEAVLGHEVAHIANGDMVTMTLIQGVMNAFVMFFARIVAQVIDSALKGDDERGGGLGFLGYMFTIMAFEMVFGLIGQVFTSYFSRLREFRADADSGKLCGNHKMIRALQALKVDYPTVEADKGDEKLAYMQISSKSSWLSLFSTHPSLDDRIEALKKG